MKNTARKSLLLLLGALVMSCGPVNNIPLTAPSSPTGLSLLTGSGQVTVSWPPVSGATSYNVYYGTSSGNVSTRIDNAASPAMIPLSNGTVYYFAVTALNGGSESSPSLQVSAKPGAKILVAGNMTFPGQFAVDANNVYWTEGVDGTGNTSTGSVKMAPLTGSGAAVTLATAQNSPFGIAVDSTSVYWTETAGGNVKSVPIGGGTVTTLAYGLNNPQYVAVDANNVYFTELGTYGVAVGERLSDGTVNKILKVGPNTFTRLATALNFPGYLAIDAYNVYWTELASSIPNTGAVKQAGISSSCKGSLCGSLATGLSGSQYIAVDSANVFFWSGYGAMSEVPIGGNQSKVAPVLSGMTGTQPLAVDSVNLYWTETANGGTLKSFPKTNGVVPSTLASLGLCASCSTMGVVADSTYIYWMEGDVFNGTNWTGVGTIKKILK